MTYVWIVWGVDKEGKFIAGIYDHKVRAEQDMRLAQQDDRNAGLVTNYYLQEKEITK